MPPSACQRERLSCYPATGQTLPRWPTRSSPNRLLTRGAGTLEVAHEALLRRPPIDGWLDAQKDALKRRDDVLKEAAEWADGTSSAYEDKKLLLIRRGERLKGALDLAANPDFASALAPAKDYLTACHDMERAAGETDRRRARSWQRMQAFTGVLMLAVIVGLLARMYEREVRMQSTWVTTFAGHGRKATELQGLKPGDAFSECAKVWSEDQPGKNISKSCPDMVVIPSGSFKMGAKDDQHDVTIAQPFAVSKFAITFDQWDACVASGGCDGYRPNDMGWGRGTRPVIHVNWLDSHQYVDWLNRMAGTTAYRLLTEPEFEYAARAGTTTAYPWGDEIGTGNAHCRGCRGNGDNERTSNVGSFAPNPFGLHDMHGNVNQWLQECSDPRYKHGPTSSVFCGMRLVRGGAWNDNYKELHSAHHSATITGNRAAGLGFRVARSVTFPRTL